MIKLPKQLDAIPNLRHALYADDITLRTQVATSGQQERNLQEAIDAIERDLRDCGLQCAPEKLELLVLRERT